MCSTTAVLLLVLISVWAECGFVAGDKSFSLTVTPRHVRARHRDNVTVMCQADVEFSDCQFTWWDLDDDKEGPVFDFSQGPNSESAYLTNATQMDWRLAGYRYFGEGLRTGQCGIQLLGVLLRYRMVACRVRTLNNSWNYATMTICAEAVEPAELSFAPTEPVALVGGSQEFLCKSSSPLATCNFRFQGMELIKLTNKSSNFGPRNNVQSNNRNNRNNTTSSSHGSTPVRTALWTTYGSGLNQGQCGVVLQEISEERNGWVYFDAETVSRGFDRRVFYLTVAKSPAYMNMEVYTEVIDGITYHSATCNVSESRPAANITWYLGDVILRQDKLDDQPQSRWRWNHGLHPTWQKVSLPARTEDDGKILKCQVDHVAMARPLVAMTLVSVQATCPALTSGEVYMTCEISGKNVSCLRPVEGGTVIKIYPQCPSGHSMASGAQYITITCLSSGEWDKPVPSCIAASTSCPALPFSSDVTLECSFRGKSVFCSRPVEIGTVAMITPQCKDGYSLPYDSRYRSITCTSTGNWDKRVPQCRTAESPTCPALQFSNDVSIECTHNGRSVSCMRPMLVGTVAKTLPQCADWQTLPEDGQYRNIRCLNTGRWDKLVPVCKSTAAVLECGTSSSEGQKLLKQNGVNVNAGEVPWHVGIYKLYNNVYEQVCSGTLISPGTILTAASCFWKSTRPRANATFNSSTLQVAAGKLSRDWSDQEEHVQKRSVASVLASELYTGVQTNYQLNIALMTLTQPFDINQFVNVVCLARDPNTLKQDRFMSGKVGSVPGWGFAEEDSPGSRLKTVTMPHISHQTCYDLLSPGVKRALTQDKFCAGSTNDYEGYTVCESDSGAGIVFYNQSSLKYYVQGVASVALKPKTNREICYPSHIVSFTMTSYVIEWILENMN